MDRHKELKLDDAFQFDDDVIVTIRKDRHPRQPEKLLKSVEETKKKIRAAFGGTEKLKASLRQ